MTVALGRETALENARLCIEEERVDGERQRVESRRWWAAVQLAADIYVCQSILRGLPVRVGNLDPLILNRALRGQPHDETYITVTAEMLDAIAEAGPIAWTGKRSRVEAARAA